MSDRPTILVVEDNPVTRKMLRVALESDRYQVIEAGDARWAIAFAQQRMPDLILQDLILPDMNGFDLVARLRLLPGGRDVPILALSGFLGGYEEGRAAEAGFTAMLVKPIELNALAEAIATYLPRPVEPSVPRGAGRHVLVVDDDSMQLKLVRLYLTQLGFRVTPMVSASEALGAAQQVAPEAILSDVLMPDVDGFQFCFAVRSVPALAHVPVILMSAHYHTQADHDLARHVGANALIQRSPDLSTLSPAIEAAINTGVKRPTDEPKGALTLEHARAVIRQLGRQTAVSAGLLRRCTLQGAQLSLLGGIADALARRIDSNIVLRDVLAATLDAAAISKGALFLVADAGDRLILRHGIGFSDHETERLSTFFGHMSLLAELIANKIPVSFPSGAVARDLEREILDQADVDTAEIVPLVSGGVGIGAIVLGAKRTDMTSEDAVTFARAIGNQIVQSLDLERSFLRLAESERRYRTLMEHANDAIAVLTPDGGIREVNQRFIEIFGVGREALVGRNLVELLALGRDRQESFERPATFEERGRRLPPVEIARTDQHVVLVEFSNTPIELGGERLILSIGRDVTAQVRANTQLMVSDRMASIGTMAAGMAHEINNPLAAVAANLELVAAGLASLQAQPPGMRTVAELEEAARDAQEAATRMKVIVADMKLFSRSEDVRAVPVEIHPTIDSSVRIAQNEIRHRARLVKDYGSSVRVLANESRLGQVFLNVIVNAAQAIPEGRANDNEIRISTWTEGGEVVVEVADTGPGMSEEVLRKLFTPFFTTKPKGVGTGLGLAICERIVGELGGRISVSSKFGRGTAVRVALPIARLDEDTVSLVPTPREATRRGRILVVDDEELILRALRRQLSSQHEVVALTCAEEALDRMCAGEQFDMILCDVMMPTMTGMDLHARLCDVAPQQADRIVFLTGGAFTASTRAFLDRVSNRCLEKPFNYNELHALIDEHLR